MNNRAEAERQLRRVLEGLGPYLHDVILIGGWVPYLYQRYGQFPEWASALSGTTEADILVPKAVPPHERSLADILRNAGFEPAQDRDPAAIWERKDASGDTIEFLAAHDGTARQLSSTISIPGQPHVGAIPLDRLAVLVHHTQTLAITARSSAEDLKVRVPTLGAYVTNKAATFPDRVPTRTGPNPKRGKDLVYLRDIMAGGDDVRARVGSDLIEVRRTDDFTLSRARSNIQSVTRSKIANPALAEAAEQLLSRERIHDLAWWENDILGYLGVLEELVERAASRKRVPKIPNARGSQRIG